LDRVEELPVELRSRHLQPHGGLRRPRILAPSIHEIVVTKDTDISSTKLVNEALQGEGQKVKIDFVKTDKGNLEVYMQYTLEDCMISGYSKSSGGDRPVESISLNFTKVEFKNVAMKDKNDTGDPDTVGYDLATANVQ